MHQVAVAATSGPLPSAKEFEGYENTLVGSAERILMMAEKQQQHIFEMNSLQHQGSIDNNEKIHQENLLQIKSTFWLNMTKIVSSILICVCLIGTGMFAIYKGFANVGAWIIDGTVVAVIGKYVADKFISKPHN